MLPRESFLPFALPTIDSEEIGEVVRALESGWLSTGPRVRDFESAFGEHVGASHAVAVSSCTAGLHLALRALGIGPGDEVLVPTMTFCSTANVVEHVGARPVLVDIGPDGNIDLDCAARRITARTKAIMPVHFAGQPVDLDAVYSLAAAHDLAVVEDAAHAVEASYHGVPVGADRACTASKPRRAVVFSFYATKNLTTGEGGMVVTADEEWAASIRLLSLHGMSRDAWKRYSSSGSWFYEVTTPGFKANMTDLQAAIGLHQLAKIGCYTADRRRQAAIYDEAFSETDLLLRPVRHDDRSHVFHLYVIRLQLDRLAIDRSQFIDELRDLNIGTSVHFIPVHSHPYYRDTYGHSDEEFPVAGQVYSESISLPIYPRMTDDDVSYVAEAVLFLLEKYAL